MDDSGINLKSSQKLMSRGQKIDSDPKVNRSSVIKRDDPDNFREPELRKLNTYERRLSIKSNNKNPPPPPQIHQKYKKKFTKNSLIQLFQTNIAISNVPYFLKKSQIPNSQMQVAKSLTNFICSDCNYIKGQVRLSCSHLVCIGCYKENLNNFEKFPNISTFKSIRCEQCQLLPNKFELYYFLDLNPARVDKFLAINIKKKCNFCSRNLNLMTEYLPELVCLHLCRECYIEQLFFYQTKCFVCNIAYKNISFTRNRKETCFKCNYTGSIVKQAFRSYSGNKFICFNCQQNVVNENSWISIFGDFDKKRGIQIFSHFFNKTCPACDERKALCDFVVCEICGNFKCDDCNLSDRRCGYCMKMDPGQSFN